MPSDDPADVPLGTKKQQSEPGQQRPTASEKLEHQLDFIRELDRSRASIQEIADRLKSERDRGKKADYQLLLKVLESEERLLSAMKSRHDLFGEIAQWKEELSSPDFDSASPVEFIERIRRFPSLENPSPPSISQGQYLQELVESAEFRLTKLDAEIPRFERKYYQLYELALRVLPGFKPDEILKKPAAESVQVGDRVPTPGHVLIDRDVLLALIGQMAPKAMPGGSGGARTRTPPAPRQRKRKKKSSASGPIPDLVQKTTPGTRKSGKKTKKSQDARSTSLFESEFDHAVAKLLSKKPGMKALDVYVYLDTHTRIELPAEMKTKITEKRTWVSAYHYSKAQRHALTERVSSVRRRLEKARN